MMRFSAAVATALFFAAPLSTSAVESDCETLASTVRSATRIENFDAAKAAYGEMADYCDAAQHEPILDLIQSKMIMKAKQSKPMSKELVETAHRLRPTWRSYEAMGQAAWQRRQFYDAGMHFQAAANAIVDLQPFERTRLQADYARVFKRGAEARLLSNKYVASVASTNGTHGGTDLGVRGMKIRKAPFPLFFPSGKTTLTENGQKYFADMLAMLRRQKPASITLTGHTDSDGPNAYNKKLSENRAAAIARLIRENGLEIEVLTEGKGEEEPYEADEREYLTEDDYKQMCRRVVLTLPPGTGD